MENKHSKEWTSIAINFTKNPKKPIECPVCKDSLLIVTPVGKEEKVSDIYFQCAKCNAHNVMSIAAPYQKKMFQILCQDNGDN